MSFPAVPKVLIRFGTGPSFGQALILGSATDGILGTNVLGTTTAAPIDISAQVQAISIRRGKDTVLDSYQAGYATVELLDLTGDWNPDNPTGPYYGELLPLRQVRIAATYNNVDCWLFSGYITRYDYRFEPSFDAAIVTLTLEDGFRLLYLAQLEAIAGAAAGDTTSERIVDVLEAASWPSTMVDASPGGITVQADPGDLRPVLSILQNIEETELGALFMAANGDVTFRTRAALAQTATGTQTVFADNGTGIPYVDLELLIDDNDLANDVIVERDNGTPQQLDNPTSIATYFRRTVSRSGLLMETDAAALNQANAILNYRSTPQLEVRGLAIEMNSADTNRITAGLSIGIGDPIQVIRSQPGGTTITADLIVQSIQHDILPGEWTTRFGTARPLSVAFVLGSNDYGVLGTSTL